MKITPLADELIQSIIELSRQAGAVIMGIYTSEFDIHIKDDQSPLTEADTKANTVIIKGLEKIAPGIPILSEEGQDIPFEERANWDTYWLVDPLDGTKEFIKKNDEFTVNIALLENNQPVFGVVFAPALNRLYWGSYDRGSFKSINGDTLIPIFVKSQLSNPVHIAVSRSHPSPQMDRFMCQFDEYDLHPMGSSLKLCTVSDGTVPLSPRLGPTMEWDTAASHAIIRAAGGELINVGTNEPLEYNKQDLLNPEFIAGHLNAIRSLELVN